MSDNIFADFTSEKLDNMDNRYSEDISDTNSTINTSVDDISTNNDSPNRSSSTVILVNSPNTHRTTYYYDNSRVYSEGLQCIMVIDSGDGSIPPLEYFQRTYIYDANTSSESDEQENSVAESTSTELLDEPNYPVSNTEVWDVNYITVNSCHLGY